MAEKMQKGIYDYNDFLKQMKWIKRMGSLKGLLSMLPGVGSQVKNLDIDEKQFSYIESIVFAMTKEERRHPNLLDESYSRRQRIARGSGRPYNEVNGLIRRFNDMKKQMKQLSGMSEEDLASGRMPKMNPQVSQKKGKGKGRGNFRI